MSTPERPSEVLRRAVCAMRVDAARRAGMPDLFVPAVAGWLEIEAAAEERKLPDDSGTLHVALRIARAYLEDAEVPEDDDGEYELAAILARHPGVTFPELARAVLADGRFGRLDGAR